MLTSSPATDPSIEERVEHVRSAARQDILRDVDDRVTQLRRLRHFLVEHEDLICGALATDLGKSSFEAHTTEIGFTITEIDHALEHIRKWTSERKVSLPLHFRPGKARIAPEPLGSVLIIAPWNYPLMLLLAPLVPAIAAGNTAVLKPSEVAPATAAMLADQLPRHLDQRVVQVVNGGVEETTELLAMPFDHIFYTGNGNVGRIVMRAAAEHLTPVTLELGGKSPAIVTSSARIDVAARRIAFGKFLNAGQSCVAPDYVLVPEVLHDRFVAKLVETIHTFFGDDPSSSPDYGRIVNERHHDRLVALLDAGGFTTTAIGGDHDRAERYFAPTVVTGVATDAAVMDDEIFGPILPIVSYRELDQAIEFVCDRPKPLALYAFGEDHDQIEHVVDHTSSGGVTVNPTMVQLTIDELPFGGVGASGMGAYHGEQGFRTFSHDKSILIPPSRPDPGLLYPPYGELAKRILRKVL